MVLLAQEATSFFSPEANGHLEHCCGLGIWEAPLQILCFPFGLGSLVKQSLLNHPWFNSLYHLCHNWGCFMIVLRSLFGRCLAKCLWDVWLIQCQLLMSDSSNSQVTETWLCAVLGFWKSTMAMGKKENLKISRVMWVKQCHKPPIWEWFIPPIYGDWGMVYGIVLPTHRLSYIIPVIVACRYAQFNKPFQLGYLIAGQCQPRMTKPWLSNWLGG